LDQNGKPNVGIAEIIVPCDSPNMVESKSLKLYLNSLNEHRFDSLIELRVTIASDLQKLVGAEVIVDVFSIDQYAQKGLHKLAGICLDDLELPRVISAPDPELLSISDSHRPRSESVYSHLLKSNCPVTAQPDWASVQVSYRGRAINHQSLLSYVVSFRHHQAFHEQCVEKMFTDISRQCEPESLTVIARYTRRGGLDINPWRSTESHAPRSLRLGRQ
jgi:7-cyano-7-deazaguanine reductase